MSLLKSMFSFLMSSEVQQDKKDAEKGTAVHEDENIIEIHFYAIRQIDEEPDYNRIQHRCMLQQIRNRILKIADLAGHRYAISVGPMHDSGMSLYLYTPVTDARKYIMGEIESYYFSENSTVQTVEDEPEIYCLKDVFNMIDIYHPTMDEFRKK